MDYVEALNLVRVRQDLRDHLRAERAEDAWRALERLAALVALDPSLRGEYERWRVHLEMLPAAARAAA